MRDFFMTAGLSAIKFAFLTAAMVGGIFAGKGLKSLYDGKKQKNS